RVGLEETRVVVVVADRALGGAFVRFVLVHPPSRAPGDVTLAADTTAQAVGLRATARAAVRLARPLAPGERVDLDQADVTEITRLPRVGPALARRIVDWRAQHGPFGSLARLDSVSCIGPHLLEAIRPYVIFSGSVPSV